MITISPVRSAVPHANLVRSKNNTSFKANPAIKISEKSLSILQKAYELYGNAESRLAKSSVLSNKFEIGYISPRKVPTIMSKFDQETGTLVRMQRSMEMADAVRVNIDSFTSNARLKFLINLNDDITSKSHGVITDFKWEVGNKQIPYEEGNFDRIIQSYFS